MIKAFLQKHKQTVLNHIELLSYLLGVALFLMAIFGAFGPFVSILLSRIILGCIIIGIYMLMYGIWFGPRYDNGFP